MKKLLSIATCTLVAALAAACSATSNRLDRMYAALQSDVAEQSRQEGFDPKIAQRHAERGAAVREMVEAGEVKKGTDKFHAAVLLVETDDLELLKMSEQLAFEAAAEGVDLARRVAAEAIDKQLVKRRLPQRYGTQYEWVHVLRAWRLYPIDPLTTDADRAAMGVPPLAEIRRGEARLNEATRAE
jgi:hypothetical protein